MLCSRSGLKRKTPWSTLRLPVPCLPNGIVWCGRAHRPAMRYAPLMTGRSRTMLALALLWAVPLSAASFAEAEVLIQQERLAEAETMLAALASKSAADLPVRFRLAYVQFRLRKLDAARTGFAALVRAAPPALSARYFLGRIELLSARPAEAIRWLEPVVQVQDTTYDAASQLALAYAAAGQWQRALEPLRTAIQREPWDGGLYYRLGRLHQHLQQPELAREALATAARLKEAGRENVEALTTAAGEFRAGRTSSAVEQLRRVAEQPATEPNVLLAAGLLYTNMQLPAQALATFRKAAQMAETQFAAQFNYGLALLRNGQTADALPVLERAVALLPQSAEAQRTLGLAAVIAQQYAAAVSALEQAQQLEPGHTRTASLLATAYLRTNQAAKAITVLEPLSANTSDPTPALLSIEALQQVGQHERALTAARAARQQFPDNQPARMALAQLLTRAGHYQEARPVFAELLAAPQPPPEAMLGMADTLQKAGEHAAALEHYRRALDYRATMLPARLGLARSLVALRQLDEARRVLEDGRRDHDREPSLHVELARLYTRLRQPDLAAQATQRVAELKAGTNP